MVLSSRRDPPIRLHWLRLADDLAELRAEDLRFTEREMCELPATADMAIQLRKLAAEARPSPSGNDTRGCGHAMRMQPPGDQGPQQKSRVARADRRLRCANEGSESREENVRNSR
jgi:hypothetical protein